MATPSSSKKIQAVQQAGVSRVAGQRRPLGYPAAVIGIIVVGCILVWFARDARINVDGERPRAGIDTWYQAYGTYSCDEYLENLARPAQGTDIEALGNGLILVGPQSEDTAGDNATFSHFFEAQGIEVTSDSITLPDGTEIKAGDSCGEGDDATTDTKIKMFVWPPQAGENTEPDVIDGDFAKVRFEQNGAAFALALVPADTDEIPLPPSTANFASPTENLPDRPTADGEVPTTTAAPTTTEAPADGEATETTEAPAADATTTTEG